MVLFLVVLASIVFVLVTERILVVVVVDITMMTRTGNILE